MFEFFDYIYEFIALIPTLISDAIIYLAAQGFIFYIEAKLYAVTFAWDIAQVVIAELNISAQLQSVWGMIDSQTMNTLAFFRIPEALNLILAAFPTKLILRMMGF